MATPTYIASSAQITIGGTPVGERLTKTSGATDVYNATARTTEQLAAIGDYVEFEILGGDSLLVGLSNVDAPAVADFPFVLSFIPTQFVEVRQAGIWKGELTQTLAARNKWRIDLIDVSSTIRARARMWNGSAWTTGHTMDVAIATPVSLAVAIAQPVGSFVSTIDIAVAASGGGGNAPTTYNLRADTTPVIPAGWPGSPFELQTPAVGSFVVDPNFGTPVYRMTGPATSTNGGSNGLTGAPNMNAIASDDQHVLVMGSNTSIIYNFDPDTGVFSEDHRITPGKDPGFARAPSKPTIIYAPRFNGFMQFNSYDIVSRAWSTLFDIKSSGDLPTEALVSDRDFQTEIYSSEAENPEILVMCYGGSEIMVLGGSSIHGQVLVTAQAQNALAGRSVTVTIASTANAPLSVSDTGGALTVTLGTDSTAGVASTTKNTATLVKDAIDALAGWIASLPFGSTGANAITSAMATKTLSGAGSGIQENWIYLTAIDAANSGTRWTYDLWRGLVKVNGGAWTQVLNHDGTSWAGRVRVHSLAIDRSGEYINIDVAGTSARRAVINLNTGRIHDVNDNMWLGHYCMGWRKEVNSTEDGARPPQWLLHDYTQGGAFPTYRRLINPVYPGAYMAHGEHSNWNNARSDAHVPIATGTGYAPFLYTWDNYLANSKPLLGEIGLISTDPDAVQGTNQFYRACSSQMQTYDTGLGGDTNTYTQSRYHFRTNQFPQITHDGRWLFFVSNWNYTLGTHGLLTDHSSALPAGLPDYRRDVFFVKLEREAVPGQASNPIPANNATNVGLTPTLSWTAGGGAATRTVRFGTLNPPPTVSASQTGTTYVPGTLLYSTTYYWRIDETNVSGTTNGIVWSFTTIAAPPVNVPPTVSLTAPIIGEIFQLGEPITLTANAADSDGSITQVEFYNGQTLLGSDNASPYSFVWQDAGLGEHSLQAKAIDNQGASTLSSVVTILVIPLGVPPHRKIKLDGPGDPSSQGIKLIGKRSKLIRLT